MDLSNKKFFAERATRPPSDSDFPVDWGQCIKLAKAGACDGVNAWLAGLKVNGGKLDGTVGRLTPGSLQSNGIFRQIMWTAMKRGGAPDLVSVAFSDTLANHWKAWFDGYEIELEYRGFDAVESSFADPIANKPVMFAKGKSLAEAMLTSENLAAAIQQATLSIAFQQGVYEACFWFSEWFIQRFDEWRNKILLTNVIGSGPVPSYAPPAVMSGPVVGGTLTSRRPLLPDHGVFRLAR
jgi:hypothetical protein